MKAGDIIKCSSLDDAVERVDALIRNGWDVDLEYKAGSKPVLTVKDRVEE